MRRFVTIPLLAALIAPPLVAQTAELLGRYEADRSAMLELVDGLTAEQWSYKPAADRWSLAEILEHVVVNEKIVWETLTQQLADVEVTEQGRAQAEAVESQIASTLQDRTQRFQAPEFVQPTGRWAGGDEVVGMFKEVRHAMMQWLGGVDFDLRTKTAPNPIIQADMDARTWVVVAVEHSARHQQQMVEVMEDAGFPGR